MNVSRYSKYFRGQFFGNIATNCRCTDINVNKQHHGWGGGGGGPSIFAYDGKNWTGVK